ncbi:hypothetical protein [Rubritalea tangerina]|uniref:hypothetical protein n=1 Tax=Rubritalea tangerina TaxID=430798 RepID=UPI003610C94F
MLGRRPTLIVASGGSSLTIHCLGSSCIFTTQARQATSQAQVLFPKAAENLLHQDPFTKKKCRAHARHS